VKVGDVVIRAYAWATDEEYGIIIESAKAMPYQDEFTDDDFLVFWSDGRITREMDLELDPAPQWESA
jgi:hypothetical protein